MKQNVSNNLTILLVCIISMFMTLSSLGIVLLIIDLIYGINLISQQGFVLLAVIMVVAETVLFWAIYLSLHFDVMSLKHRVSSDSSDTKTTVSTNLAVDEVKQEMSKFKDLVHDLEQLMQSGRKMTELIGAINRSMVAFNSKLASIESSELNELKMELKKALVPVMMEFTQNGFRVLWNSLPYHQHFERFTDDDKVAYFDALQTGNWATLRRREKAEWSKKPTVK